MKTMKKWFAALLVIAMMLTMNTTALAATQSGTNEENKGTITIENAAAKQTYKIYQIFELEGYSYDDTSEETKQAGAYAYTIKSNSPWYDFVKKDIAGTENGAGAAYVNLELLGTDDKNVSTYYVTWNTTNYGTADDYAAFAKKALEYANKKEDLAAGLGNATPGAENPAVPNSANAGITKNTDGTYEITFSNLNLGYYLVDSSMGALCSLDTTNSDVKMREKNEEPTNEKKVQEDSTISDENPNGTYGDINDADINQTVKFQSTIIAQKGADAYVFHDKMSEGLDVITNKDSQLPVVTVTLYKAEAGEDGKITYPETGNPVDPDKYAVKKTDEPIESNDSDTADNCTFHVVFTQDFCDTLANNDKLVISYSAILNNKAFVGNTGNTNESWLDYGDNSHTQSSTTKTYTWELNIYKYTTHGGDETSLADAEFVLYKEVEGVKSYAVMEKDTTKNSYKITGWTENSSSEKKENENDENYATTLTTTADGKIQILGLDADIYYLLETKAPKGYNKLAGPVKIVIARKAAEKDEDAGKANATETAVITETVTYYTYDAAAKEYSTSITASNNTVRVLNNTGSELPSTGGMGTAIFYILGAVLVIGSGVLLVVRRRMNAEK